MVFSATWRVLLAAGLALACSPATAAPSKPAWKPEPGQNCLPLARDFADLVACKHWEISSAAYTFTVVPALPCKGEVIVAEVSMETQAGIPVFRKWSQHCPWPRPSKPRLQWIDGRACPALERRLATLPAIDDVRIVGPRFDYRQMNGVLDGADYEISAPAIYQRERAAGSIRLNGNVDSPVARWIEATFKAVAPCWREGLPPSDKPTRRP